MNHFENPASIHNTLNPVLWDQNGNIKKDVQVALLRIAKEYWNFLSINTRVSDIVVSGSQANYNYGPHSDVDLHLIVDYSDVNCDDMAVDELFKTKRDLWKAEHNITIHDLPVEVYVEDTAKPAVSSTYSLIKNTWIKKPEKIAATPDIDRIQRVVKAWMVLFTVRLATKDLEQIEQVKDMLWAYRRKGLDVAGEMGEPNLVFKVLRNSGVTDMLLTAISKLKDRKLSLEERN
jgi:hypothetical protein